MARRQTHSEEASTNSEESSVFSGIAGIAKNIFGLLVSRIELVALELGEVRNNLFKLLLIGALGVVVALFALGGWTALLIVLTWASMGWKILLLIAVAYTLLAIGILCYARFLLKQGRLSLPATMAELRHDRDALL